MYLKVSPISNIPKLVCTKPNPQFFGGVKGLRIASDHLSSHQVLYFLQDLGPLRSIAVIKQNLLSFILLITS